MKNYILKIKLTCFDPKIWREIEISEEANLDDLHLAIQKAFDFYNDHLYSFFMDGKMRRSEEEYTIREPEGEAELKSGMARFKGFTDEKKLKDFNLKEKQKFIYLYDFGDNLDFEIKVKEIKNVDKLLTKPKVINSQGDAPDQYEIRGCDE